MALQVVTSEHIHKSAEHFMGEIRWYWGIMWPAFERVRCLTRPGSGDAAKVGVGVGWRTRVLRQALLVHVCCCCRDSYCRL